MESPSRRPTICRKDSGRTPRVFGLSATRLPGRDHWGAVQSVWFAGGGVKGGAVIGSSDRIGGYPHTDPQTPEQMAATIYSVINCQEAYAKALCVPRAKLAEVQQAGDVLAAHQIITGAFRTDVRPLLAQVREEMGIAPDPIAAYYASGYEDKVRAERGVAAPAAGGFQ